jgi:hypothetical protein
MSKTTSSIRLSDIPTETPRDGEGRIMLGPEETRDRLDKLEAQCTDLFRQLRNMRGQHSELLASMAAHIEQDTDRLDATDRRVAAINAGLKDAGDLLLKHEDKINEVSGLATLRLEAAHRRINNANNYFNLLADYLGVRLDATEQGPRLVPKEGVVPMFVRVGNIQDRVTAVELGLEFIQHSNQRLVDLGTGTTATATYCGNPTCGQCYPKPRRKSLGWFNVHISGNVVGPFVSRDAANAKAFYARAACIEIFEGDGL